MSVSLLDTRSIFDGNLDEFFEEKVVVSLPRERDSQWNKLFLQLMTPLNLRLRTLELLFLTVALGPENEALRCWERFRTSGMTLEELDSSNYSIFPLLSRRLAEIAPNDSYVEKLRGHYRYTWTQKQLKLKELAEGMRLLNDHGISSVVSKDVGMSLISDSECVRQINWLALLVAPENFARAQSLLNRACPNLQASKYVPAKTDAFVWRDATPVEICGVTGLTLSDADLLFQHLVSAKYDGISQREWFTGCLRLLPLFENETALLNFRDRVENSCGMLDVLQAWSFFLRIAELVRCTERGTKISEILASLHVSSKEIFYRSGNFVRWSFRGRKS